MQKIKIGDFVKINGNWKVGSRHSGEVAVGFPKEKALKVTEVLEEGIIVDLESKSKFYNPLLYHQEYVVCSPETDSENKIIELEEKISCCYKELRSKGLSKEDILKYLSLAENELSA